MLSRTTEAFRAKLVALPKPVQDKATSAYALWAENPHHPSLRFKKVHSSMPVYSVRIERAWRAVGVLEGDTVCGSGSGPMPTMKLCYEAYKLRATDEISYVRNEAGGYYAYGTPFAGDLARRVTT